MPRMTKQKKIEKLAQDQVDIAKEWYNLVPYIYVEEEGKAQYEFFEKIMSETLRRFTNIEEKINDSTD